MYSQIEKIRVCRLSIRALEPNRWPRGRHFVYVREPTLVFRDVLHIQQMYKIFKYFSTFFFWIILCRSCPSFPKPGPLNRESRILSSWQTGWHPPQLQQSSISSSILDTKIWSVILNMSHISATASKAHADTVWRIWVAVQSLAGNTQPGGPSHPGRASPQFAWFRSSEGAGKFV